jgi:hypothetical protein
MATRLARQAPAFALAFGLAVLLAACSPEPFDATSAWQPSQSREGRAYLGGQQAEVPAGPFAPFDPERTPREQAELTENPWTRPAGAPVVSVCYGRWANSADQVRATAKRLCPAGAGLRLERQDAFWNGCPLFQPNRASFRCVPPEGAGDTAAGS